MSVIVKGMDMPKDCGECPLAIQAYPIGNTQSWYLACMPLGQGRTVKIRTRPDWCPLEEAEPIHRNPEDAYREDFGKESEN